MLDKYFPASKMLDYLRSGPSGLHLDGFAAALKRQGYTHDTAVRYVRAAAHLGHVLAGLGGLPSDIDLQAFSEHLRTCRCPRAKGGRYNHHTIYGARLFRRYRRNRHVSPRRSDGDARRAVVNNQLQCMAAEAPRSFRRHDQALRT